MRRHTSTFLVALTLVASVTRAQSDGSRAGGEVGDASVELLAERLASLGKAAAPRFSPDGKRLALVSDLTGVPQVWTIPATGGWPTAVTAGKDPVGAVTWSPRGDQLAISIFPGGGMNGQVYVARPDGSDLRRLTDGGKETNRLGEWSADGRFVTVISNRRRSEMMDALLVAADSGRMELVAELAAAGSIDGVSRDGQRILLSRERYPGENDLYLLQLPSRQETLLTPHEPPGSFRGALSPDGATVYVRTEKGRDRPAFARIRVDAAGGVGPIEVIAERSDAELGGFVLSHSGDEALLEWNVEGKAELVYVALPSGKQRPGPALPAELVGDIAYSEDDRTLAASVFGSTSPQDVWTWERASGRLRQLTVTPHAGVDLARLVKPQLVHYHAQDGLALSGWLYAPPGARGPVPYVLSFHGGPEGQEQPLLRPDYQALLVQGIGVFAPNVRGSGGFGKKFLDLDNGTLRFAAIRDIKASADYLLIRGLAQRGRLGIMGASYGGYMVMAGVTEYPDLFRAGVDLYGIVNLATFFAHTEPRLVAPRASEFGDPVKEADLLARLSPIYKLDRIQAALMVQHGANDSSVPMAEAEQIVNAMNARGVPVEYLSFPDEGHGWQKPGNRLRSITAMASFFRRHLLETSARWAPRPSP
jgi:dipeptidyl aminopeptidase/acylaminoacyl peptidase